MHSRRRPSKTLCHCAAEASPCTQLQSKEASLWTALLCGAFFAGQLREALPLRHRPRRLGRYHGRHGRGRGGAKAGACRCSKRIPPKGLCTMQFSALEAPRWVHHTAKSARDCAQRRAPSLPKRCLQPTSHGASVFWGGAGRRAEPRLPLKRPALPLIRFAGGARHLHGDARPGPHALPYELQRLRTDPQGPRGRRRGGRSWR